MIRKMNSLSQEKLGDAIGVTFQQVQKYEKGTNRVGASRLQQIATVLGVDVGVFFADAPTTDQSGGSSSTFDLFKTSEGVRIARAVAKIQDPIVRQKLAELVEATVALVGDAEAA